MAGYPDLSDAGYGFTVETWRENKAKFERLNVLMLGRGVVSGLLMSYEDLDLTIAAGVANFLSCVPWAEQTVAVPDDETNYVWIGEEGEVVFSESSADPGGNMVCLGQVTAEDGAITERTYDRKMWSIAQPTAWTRRIGPATFDDANAKVDLAGAFNATGQIATDTTMLAAGKIEGSYFVAPKLTDAPPGEADKLILFAKEVAGRQELHLVQPDDDVTQITNPEPIVEHKATSYTITEADNKKCFTNSGAAALVEFTLPAERIGLEFEFAVMDNNGMRQLVVGTDVILIGDALTSGTGLFDGYAESTTVGSTIKLKGTGAGAWMAFGPAGTWAVG